MRLRWPKSNTFTLCHKSPVCNGRLNPEFIPRGSLKSRTAIGTPWRNSNGADPMNGLKNILKRLMKRKATKREILIRLNSQTLTKRQHSFNTIWGTYSIQIYHELKLDKSVGYFQKYPVDFDLDAILSRLIYEVVWSSSKLNSLSTKIYRTTSFDLLNIRALEFLLWETDFIQSSLYGITWKFWKYAGVLFYDCTNYFEIEQSDGDKAIWTVKRTDQAP